MIQLSTDKGFYTTINCGFHKEYNTVMEYKDFAKRLKELQSEKGIKTQIELSDWLGYSKSIVSAWMRGEKIPSMDTSIKLSDKFGCNAEWLLRGIGKKHQNEKQNFDGYINVSDLPNDLQKDIEDYANFKRTQNKEKTENKPLTARPENVGGGGGKPA